MSVTEIPVQRFSLTCSKSFEQVVSEFEAVISRPNMAVFLREIADAKSYAELEQVVENALGPSGLMEFIRFDIGEVLRKRNGTARPKILRVILGNPLIMRQMAEHVSDAASYAPVTILIDERSDGVHVSYDRMGSFLAPYENELALKVARDLDAKIEALLTAVCT